MSLGAQDSARASRTTNGDGESDVPAKPYFEITGGNPSAEEVGILAAVFAAAEGNAVSAGEQPGLRDDWGAIEDKLRTPYGYTPSSYVNSRRF